MRIRRVSVQRDIAMRAGLALFFLIGKDHHGELAKNLVATLPRIIRFREKHPAPFIAHITRPDAKFAIGSHPGNVDMVLTKEQWLVSVGRVRRS